MGCRKQGEATAALVPEFAVEDLPSAELQPRLAVKDLPLGRTLDDDDMAYNYFYFQFLIVVYVCFNSKNVDKF